MQFGFELGLAAVSLLLTIPGVGLGNVLAAGMQKWMRCLRVGPVVGFDVATLHHASHATCFVTGEIG